MVSRDFAGWLDTPAGRERSAASTRQMRSRLLYLLSLVEYEESALYNTDRIYNEFVLTKQEEYQPG